MLSVNELTSSHLKQRIEMDNQHAKHWERLLKKHDADIIAKGQSDELKEKHEKELEQTNRLYKMEAQRMFERHEQEFEKWREEKQRFKEGRGNISFADDLEKEKKRQEFKKELENLRRVTRGKDLER